MDGILGWSAFARENEAGTVEFMVCYNPTFGMPLP